MSTHLADGSLARDGWQALTQYDANGDGKIDLSEFAGLVMAGRVRYQLSFTELPIVRAEHST